MSVPICPLFLSCTGGGIYPKKTTPSFGAVKTVFGPGQSFCTQGPCVLKGPAGRQPTSLLRLVLEEGDEEPGSGTRFKRNMDQPPHL